MERRRLAALSDHGNSVGAFATKWEGWKNPNNRSLDTTGRINVTHPDDIEIIDDQMGLYVALYEPSSGGTRYVVYVGYCE
jgi:hypothetical protein